MIAVTIGFGEPFARLATYAAQAVRHMTGLKTVILDGNHFAASGLPHPHHLKLKIFDLIDDDEVLYFDSDIVCLNPWNPKRFARTDALVAVADRPAHISGICRDWDIPVREFFNAGLMILNRSCHHDWFRETERVILDHPGVRTYQSTDQDVLNITRCRLGLKLELLDRRYNWIGFGTGKLCHEIPVFMAHSLREEYSKMVNIDFFEGRYKPPFNWHIEINEDEMNKLKNQTLCVKGGNWEKPMRLNSDATIGPPYYPGWGRHWFVHNKCGSLRLAITSDTEILREFTRVSDDVWESVQELQF